MSSILKTVDFREKEFNFVSSHPLPTWIVGPDLQIQFSNSAATDLYGYSFREFKQLGFLSLFAKQSQGQFFQLACGVDPKFSCSCQQYKKDGTEVWMDIYANRITVDGENFLQVTAVDSNQKKVEKELKLLAHLVEETSDVLTAADINFIPLTWNRAAEKIYGLTAEQVIGTDLREFLSINYQGASRDEVRDTIRQTGEWRGEASFIRPTDNQLVTLLVSFKKLKEDGYLISATDITERKEAESRLRESEARFKEMADSSPAMIWLSDENDLTVYTNKKWIDFTGKNISSIDNGWESLVHEDDLLKAKTEYSAAVELKKQVTIIYRLRRFDGVYRWVHDISVPRFLSDGKFIGYIGSVIDIEDEKKKQEQLVYQATILENVSDIIIATDTEFKIKVWNKIAAEYYGIDEAKAMGRPMQEVMPFTFYDTTMEQALIDLRENGIWKGEVSAVNNKDVTKYFFYTVKYVYDEAGAPVGFLATGQDITEKKIADEKLEESENFYRTLIADSLDGMLLLNEEGKIKFASPAVKTILGFTSEDLVGKNSFEFVHPEDIPWAFTSFQKEVIEQPEIKFITVRLLSKDCTWIWCMVRGHNLLRNPHVNSIVVYFHDDTLRKQAKDALKESEKRFRFLIRDLQIGVFLADENFRVIMCNKALGSLLSLPEEMIVGKNIYEVMPSDMINEEGQNIPLYERPLSRTLRSKQPVKGTVIGVLNSFTKERLWMMVNADPILDEEGKLKHLVCSVMDITERKKLEQKIVTEQISHQRQLTQATIDGQENERREIGKELHDNIGQQLTTIKLFLDLAKSTADDATHEMLNMALKGVSDAINEVRAMSRSLVPSTLKDLGLVDSIHELTESFIRTQCLKIEFESDDFNEDLVPENQKLTLFRIIQEQLNNIVKHAEAKNVLIRLYQDAEKLFLEIGDDGNGFDIKKTRKGLGFINIRNRAELFEGKAEIVSEAGKGCLLKISFPHQVSKALHPVEFLS